MDKCYYRICVGCLRFAEESCKAMSAPYAVIYDRHCNLCATWASTLESIDRGQTFCYVPMDDTATLQAWNITPQDCELGMIVLERDRPERRWQGSDAAEEIARLLPLGRSLVDVYRKVPGVKQLGDRAYEQIRDNRYRWFGRRSRGHQSVYPYSVKADCDRCTTSRSATL